MNTRTTICRAFTLIELLIVIVIIALLAGVLVSAFSRIKENGWSAKCRANLKTLYQAALNHENDHGQAIPYAGPYELFSILDGRWHKFDAWVNWIPKAGTTPSWPNAKSQDGDMLRPTWYGKNAISNIQAGTIWEYTSHHLDAYLCPKFKKVSRDDAVRSYAMNGFFFFADRDITHSNTSWWARNIQNHLDDRESSRLLFFAEMMPGNASANYCGIPCSTWAGRSDDDNNGGHDGSDGALDAKGNVSNPTNSPYESVGFIHRYSGQYRAHTIFLDGHIEAIPLIKINASTYSNRTFSACNGYY
jgi:prepilin-type N-terminal cleavage/methylation domain-containing protein